MTRTLKRLDSFNCANNNERYQIIIKMLPFRICGFCSASRSLRTLGKDPKNVSNHFEVIIIFYIMKVFNLKYTKRAIFPRFFLCTAVSVKGQAKTFLKFT